LKTPIERFVQHFISLAAFTLQAFVSIAALNAENKEETVRTGNPHFKRLIEL
jgi:hypothetical protein